MARSGLLSGVVDGCLARRVLIIKTGGMGDAVLLRGALDECARLDSGREFAVLCGPGSRDVMGIEAKYRLHHFEPAQGHWRSALRVVKEVRAQRYDTLVDCEQFSLLSAMFGVASGIRRRLGFVPLGGAGSRARFFAGGVPFDARRSMYGNFVRLLRLIEPGLAEDFSPRPIDIGQDAVAAVQRWWEERVPREAPYVVALHLGTGPMAYKQWPIARFAALAAEICRRAPGAVIILTGTGSDSNAVREFCNLFDGLAVNATSLGSVAETAALLHRCDLLVTNDTGVMHLGASVGTPTVGLFGATSPIQWGPLGKQSTYVFRPRVLCSPCVNTYSATRPQRCTNAVQGECMRAIEVEDVLSAARRIVRGGWLY